MLLDLYPNAIPSVTVIDYLDDILLTIHLEDIKIGFESQGDPKQPTHLRGYIKKLADNIYDPNLGGCDIIICATRTKRETVEKVDQIAIDYDYNTL